MFGKSYLFLESCVKMNDYINQEISAIAWVRTHRCPGAKSPGHQYPQC